MSHNANVSDPEYKTYIKHGDESKEQSDERTVTYLDISGLTTARKDLTSSVTENIKHQKTESVKSSFVLSTILVVK